MIGVASVTFRALNVEQVAELAFRAGLQCIEWGGDIHVPHGDVTAARRAEQICRDHGLACRSYGSYYRLGTGAQAEFAALTETADALGARTVRLWPGSGNYQQTAPVQRMALAEELHTLCEQAQPYGIRLALEYHPGSLTETPEGALWLLEHADAPNLRTYWQQNPAITTAENTAALKSVRHKLENLHIFYIAGGERRPLEQGKAQWQHWLSQVKLEEHDCLMEFVRDASPEAFLQDAATLRELISNASC